MLPEQDKIVSQPKDSTMKPDTGKSLPLRSEIQGYPVSPIRNRSR